MKIKSKITFQHSGRFFIARSFVIGSCSVRWSVFEYFSDSESENFVCCASVHPSWSDAAVIDWCRESVDFWGV